MIGVAHREFASGSQLLDVIALEVVHLALALLRAFHDVFEAVRDRFDVVLLPDGLDDVPEPPTGGHCTEHHVVEDARRLL